LSLNRKRKRKERERDARASARLTTQTLNKGGGQYRDVSGFFSGGLRTFREASAVLTASLAGKQYGLVAGTAREERAHGERT